MELEALVSELKQLIVEECEKDQSLVYTLSELDPIVGAETEMALDSLDILQISVAIKNRYGVRIERNAETRVAFENLANLADYISRKMQHE